MTQKELIKDWLDNGKAISPLEALTKFGCFRLSHIIWLLKKEGMNIEKEWRENLDTGKRWAEYFRG